MNIEDPEDIPAVTLHRTGRHGNHKRFADNVAW